MKQIYLEYELIDTKWIFERAFRELNSINLVNEHYFPVLRLLSEGFERLFKISIAIAYWNDENKIRNKASQLHDLEKLLDRLIFAYGEKQPLILLKNDQLLKRMISTLSYFARYGRYYNLDVICGNLKQDDSPISDWKQIETDIQLTLPHVEELKKLQSHISINDEILTQHDNIVNDMFRESSLIISSKLKALIKEICENILTLKNNSTVINSSYYVEKIKEICTN